MVDLHLNKLLAKWFSKSKTPELPIISSQLVSPLPLLLGVDHSLSNLKETISFLDTLDLNEKKVMLELPCYPLPFDVVETLGFNYCGYYEELADHLVEKKGQIICGDSEFLVDRALQNLHNLIEKKGLTLENYLVPTSKNPFDSPVLNGPKVISWFELSSIFCQERDPHFLKVVQDTNPDLVILGKTHIPYLIDHHYKPNHLPFELKEIPNVGYLTERLRSTIQFYKCDEKGNRIRVK